MKCRLIGIICLFVSGCSEDPSTPSATPEGRFALGTASRYPAIPVTSEDRIQAQRSITFRRQLAWRVIQRVVEPVRPAIVPSSEDIFVPRWMSWYGRDDFERIFTQTFTALSLDERRARGDITTASFLEGERWLASQLLYLPNWSEQRRSEFIASLRTNEDWHGSAGLSRTLYSSSAVQHLNTHYQDLMGCEEHECLSNEFASDAVIIKTAWTRRGHGFTVPAFDTDHISLQERLGENGRSWDIADRQIADIAGRSVSMRTRSGAVFDLTALHIMSKESQDWLWITLWWSDNPNSDFGEDRPSEMANGPWANYKMCVVSEFTESSEDEEGLRARFPSLGTATHVAHASSSLSWCSNPYIEKGPNNQKTNCIGCHQHAGTSKSQSSILASPEQGRSKERETFPADYVWSVNFGPENLRHMIGERVRYHSLDPE